MKLCFSGQCERNRNFCSGLLRDTKPISLVFISEEEKMASDGSVQLRSDGGTAESTPLHPGASGK
jgi:hypothetical protein